MKRTKHLVKAKEIDWDAEAIKIQSEIEAIDKAAEKLANKIGVLNGKLHSMGVTELKSFSTMFAATSLKILFTNASVLIDYFGFGKE